MTFKPTFAAVVAGLTLTLSAPVGAETHTIDQVIDLAALTPEGVYRFEPSYIWIAPGDTVQFLNSTGNHTVTGIVGMWPEGAEMVNIEHKPTADVTFDVPGIYGFRCKVHGRHGMYALIVVGSPESNADSIEYTKVGELGRRIFKGLFEEMEADKAKRQSE